MDESLAYCCKSDIVKIIQLVFIFFFLSLLLPSSIFAVSIVLSEVPFIITEDLFTVHVDISGASANTTNYLRVNLYKLGTTDYFGYTYNGTDWYNGTSFSNYLPIAVDTNGTWNGTVQAKIDTSVSEYKGPGEYMLKVRRYTAGGTYTWSNEATVSANLPTSTPTLTPTPTSTPTLKPTPTAKPIPANKPSATPGPTEKPKISALPSPTIKMLQEKKKEMADVLSASSDASIHFVEKISTKSATPQYKAIPSGTPVVAATHPSLLFPISLGGGMLLILSGIAIFIRLRRRPEDSMPR